MDKALKGGPELMAFLDKLPAKLANNLLRGGIRASARVVAKKAKTKVHKRSGKVAASIGVSSRGQSNGVITAKVRTRNSEKGDRGFVAVFLEHGTVAHLISSRGTTHTNANGAKMSVRTINRAARETGATPTKGGTGKKHLVIDGKFVGVSVIHPGISPAPFMGPALAEGAEEAISACASYIRARLTKEGIDAPWAGLADDEDEAA